MIPDVADHWLMGQPSPNPTPRTVVARPRLTKLIESPSLAPITLITAPAGFGKSNLAAQWAHQQTHYVAWVSLDPGRNNPSRFLEALASAIEAAVADRDAREPSPAPTATVDTILARLARLADSGDALTLIFDDYHHIENRDVHQVMDALLARLPAQAHLLLLSRTIPPLSFGRLRVQGQVRELTEADLRFTPAEAREVIAAESGGRLTPRQIARLTDRTGGWIAGIRLALLAIIQVDATQIDPLIDSFAEHQWIDDYVVEEVLGALPEDLRTFVLRTASLGSLEPALCDAMLAIDNSAALIDEVAKRLVFARRDYAAGAGVTYHALFAECIERVAARHIPTDVRIHLNRRAAEWFERHGRLEAAIDHAVRCEDWELALRAVRPVCRSLRDQDQSYSVLHWLAKLPESVILAQDDLAFWAIRALLITGQSRDALRYLRAVEPRWQQSDDSVHQAYALSCQALVAAFDSDVERSLQLIYQRLPLTPPDHMVDRLHLWSAVCDWEFLRGNDEIADEAHRQAEHCRAHLPAEQRYWTLHTEFVRTNQYAIRGDLETAERLYRHALAHLPGYLRDAEARYRHRLATIYLEWNQLDRAEAEATRCTAELEVFPWQYWYPGAWLTAAEVHWACGRHDTAEETLQRVLDLSGTYGETHISLRARALQASWWLDQGESVLARAWADDVHAIDPRWALVFSEINPLTTRLQLYIARGAYDDALALARECIDEGKQLKRWAELVPLYVWETVAQLGLRNQQAALDALRAALKLGVPGRFVRSFFPPGTDLRPFLHDAVRRLPPEESSYVQGLLRGDQPAPRPADKEVVVVLVPTLAEPLSTREREVLELLHQGLANRQIGDRLFVGERTIKKHVGNILAKLGVTNRTAAVMRAQDLGLLNEN